MYTGSAVLQIRDLVQTFQDSPRLMGALSLVALLVGAAQYALGPKHDWVESVRRRYWFKLHEVLSMLGGYAAGAESHDEYVCTVSVEEDELERGLYRGGYHRNFIAAFKYIERSGEQVPSEGSWVHRETIFHSKQGHARFYASTEDGKLDVYHHYETSWVRHPIKHYLNATQEVGDPQGTLKKALDDAGIEYTNRFDG